MSLVTNSHHFCVLCFEVHLSSLSPEIFGTRLKFTLTTSTLFACARDVGYMYTTSGCKGPLHERTRKL